MRSLLLAAATAGLVLMPSAAYADAAAPAADTGAFRLTAFCHAGASVTSASGRSIAIAATAASNGGSATNVRCTVRSEWGAHGTAQITMPGPVAVAPGMAYAPWLPLEICVSAWAAFPDGTIATLPESCRPLA